jgi:uncharacterized protein
MRIQAVTETAKAGFNPDRASLRDAVSVCLVLLYIPFAAFISPPVEPLVLAWGELGGRVLHELPRWIYVLTVLMLFVRWNGRPLHDIGLRVPGWDVLGWALLGTFGTVALALTAKALTEGIPHAEEDVVANIAELRWSWGYAICIALRAGFVEEILFRGILIEQLAVLTRRRGLSAVIAGALFVSAHALKFDWFQLLMATMATVALTLVYLPRRNLLAAIAAHTLIDMISFSHLLANPTVH